MSRYFIQIFTITAHIAHFASQINLITVDQYKHWLENTDAVTFHGKPLCDLSDLSKRNALNTIVTYCTEKIDDLCGGTCQYTMAERPAMVASGTNYLAATNNVGFYDDGGSGGSCNQFSTCGTKLQNNFCFTPGTASILVGSA